MTAQKGEGDDVVGGCTFNSLIEVPPPLFSFAFQQASCLRQEACPYLLPTASATREFNSPTPSASMSEPPSDLVPSALSRPYPEPVFVNTFPLVSPVLVSPVTAPASVFNKRARPLAPAPATFAAARTSYLSAFQSAPA